MREKQARISSYFLKKSPKAETVRSRKRSTGPTAEEENTKESNNSRGPCAPFWEIRGSSKDCPTADTLVNPTSKTRVGGAEECGRPTGKQRKGENRKFNFLEQEAPRSSNRKKDSTTGPGQKVRGKGNQLRNVKDIRNFFEERVGGTNSNPGKKGNEDSKEGSKDPPTGKNQPT